MVKLKTKPDTGDIGLTTNEITTNKEDLGAT